MLRFHLDSLYSDSPNSRRHMVLFLYAMVAPPFLLTMTFIRKPFSLYPVLAVFIICSAAFLWVFFRKKPTAYDWIFPSGIAPVLCCAIAFSAFGNRGIAFMAVLTAPLAWCAVLFEFPVVATSWLVSVCCCFYLSFSTGSLPVAAANTAIFGIIEFLVALVAYGKASRFRTVRLETLERSVSDVEIIMNEQGKIIDVNERAIEVYGYTRSEFLSKTIFELRAYDDAAFVQKQIAQLMKDRSIVFESRHVRKDGSFIWVEVNARCFNAQGNIFIHSLVRNITERKDSDEELKKQEALIGQLLQNTDQGIYGIDLDGRCTFINKSGLMMLGYSLEECLGRNMHDLIHYCFSDGRPYPVEECPIFRAKITGIGSRIDNEVLWRKGGVAFPAEYSSYPILENGSISGAVVTFSDITERRLAEEKLIIALQESDILRDKAEAANRAKSEFLASMSHEIRTPMNGVVSMAGLLVDTLLSPQQRRYAQIIQTSGEALLTLINDILDYSKIEARKLALDIVPFSLARTVREAADLIRVKAEEKGLLLRYAENGAIPDALLGDPGRLRQILLNLLGNAVKFTEKGSIELKTEIDTDDPERVCLKFTIIDTGIGISPDKQTLIFSPFTQADSSVTRRYGGTGLGLAISMKLAALMGGTAGVQSGEGKGSSFWFTACFDRQSAGTEDLLHKETDHSQPFTSGRERKDIRILVAEDNTTNQFVAVEMLRKLGFSRVDIAADGNEAIAALGRIPYDLVLMDCHMPGMDGFEATRRIRSGADGIINPSVPIVAMTALAMKGDREQVLDAGMNDYLSKPVDLLSLSGMLNKWLPAESDAGADVMPLPAEAADSGGELKVFNRKSFLSRVGGDESILIAICGAFLEDMPSQIAVLERLVMEGDAYAAGKQSHKIKGAAANVSGEAMAETASRMEQTGGTGDLSAIQLLFSQLQKDYESLRKILEQLTC